MSVNSPSAGAAGWRKRPMQARSRALVERILDAAARIFDERGYRETTTNHVAEAAGVSIGSLYQYFPNKDALLVGLAERHLDDAAPRLLETGRRLKERRPGPEALCRALVQEVADLNRSERLHRLLWTAPRIAEIDARLAELERAVAADVAWHLERYGHPAEMAALRARLLVEAVGALVHAEWWQPHHVDEAVRLVLPYVERAT